MSDSEKRIHCRVHGETACAFLCVHLRDGIGCGYHCDEAEEVDGWELTQIAADLSNAAAIYRAPFDGLHVFFLLDRFRDGRAC